MVVCTAFNLGLIYKESVLVKRLAIIFPVMFTSSVYAEDEKELMVEIFHPSVWKNIKNQMRIPNESF